MSARLDNGPRTHRAIQNIHLLTSKQTNIVSYPSKQSKAMSFPSKQYRQFLVKEIAFNTLLPVWVTRRPRFLSRKM